nr:type II secretion system F family protein [Calditerricola satsumensis]
MIAVGEETGALDELLGKVAAYYEDEVAQAAERLKSSIEPLLILLVAALVGMVVLSVLLPSFQLYRHL